MLSVEKTEINEEKIFVFEGRKPDKSFIEGKIEAEDIFIAHDMLTKEYNYSISKLYQGRAGERFSGASLYF